LTIRAGFRSFCLFNPNFCVAPFKYLSPAAHDSVFCGIFKNSFEDHAMTTRFQFLSRHAKIAMISVALGAGLMSATAVFSQNIRVETPQNIISLQAQGSLEVQQDLLTISMNSTKDGADASTVQTQLKTALDAALTEAKKVAQPGQLDVRTGAFSLYPRYGRDGKINGWQGTTELVLEGRDFARISTLAGKINTLTLGNVSFGLSREARTRVEAEVTAQAIDRFKAKALEVSKGFGFGGYTVREVNVQANYQGFVPRGRMASMEMKMSSAADAAVPVEAGRSTVVVTVAGSVQMK
jgi:predicted secreted protein